jgi:hypothetical protein
VSPTSHAKIMRLRHEPIDAEWLDDQLVELDRLAEADDRLEVVAKLGAIVREPRRAAAMTRSEASLQTEA